VAVFTDIQDKVLVALNFADGKIRRNKWDVKFVWQYHNYRSKYIDYWKCYTSNSY